MHGFSVPRAYRPDCVHSSVGKVNVSLVGSLQSEHGRVNVRQIQGASCDVKLVGRASSFAFVIISKLTSEFFEEVVDEALVLSYELSASWYDGSRTEKDESYCYDMFLASCAPVVVVEDAEIE